MRFLVDENVDARLIDLLHDAGHDVTAVTTDYRPSIADAELLGVALRERRVLITNDLGFGELVVRQRLPHAGILLLRVASTALEAQRARLAAAIRDHADDLGQFVVVSERSVRVRRTL